MKADELIGIAVAYSTDERYVPLTAVAILSLLKCHEPGSIRLYLLANDISNASEELLTGIANRYSTKLNILDVKKYLHDTQSAGAAGYTSYSAYARLFIPQLIPNEPRVVYLDCDTLVVDSILPLNDLDMHGKSYAMACDCLRNEYKKLISIPLDSPYYNSGVTVMDTKVWRERHCTERIFDHIRNVRATYMFGDQDFFSVVLPDDAAALPVRYNFLSHYFMFRRWKDVLRIMGIPAVAWNSRDDFEDAIAHPAIYHCAGQTLGRPWYRESRHPLRCRYIELAAEAGVQDLTEQSRHMEFCYRVQERLWHFLPRLFFVFACRAMYRYFMWSAYKV